MRALIQRVTHASVTIDNKIHGQIDSGLLVFVGIENEDNQEDIGWLCRKIAGMRIFGDEQGLMNKSIVDIQGKILLISQFTLFASTKKGNRPGFSKAAKPEKAIPLYEQCIRMLQQMTQTKVQTGVFGADMKVDLRNDGPVTIWIDTKNKE